MPRIKFSSPLSWAACALRAVHVPPTEIMKSETQGTYLGAAFVLDDFSLLARVLEQRRLAKVASRMMYRVDDNAVSPLPSFHSLGQINDLRRDLFSVRGFRPWRIDETATIDEGSSTGEGQPGSVMETCYTRRIRFCSFRCLTLKKLVSHLGADTTFDLIMRTPSMCRR